MDATNQGFLNPIFHCRALWFSLFDERLDSREHDILGKYRAFLPSNSLSLCIWKHFVKLVICINLSNDENFTTVVYLIRNLGRQEMGKIFHVTG